MGAFCTCYSNRFNTMQEIIDYLINEDEVLNFKLKEIDNEIQTTNTLILKNELAQRDLSVKTIKSVLAELSEYLIRVNKTYTNEEINEIFNNVQNELIDSYNKVKKQNFLTKESKEFFLAVKLFIAKKKEDNNKANSPRRSLTKSPVVPKKIETI